MQHAVFLSALLFAVVFLGIQNTQTPGRSLIKALPTLLLALWLWLFPERPALLDWMIAGLIACAVGDFLLDLPEDRGFLPGLGSFLLGHLAYSVFLAVDLGPADLLPGVGLVVLLCLSVGFFLWLRPSLPARMLMPVAFYTMVILVMTGLASFQTGRGANVMLLGALSFAASDMVLAVLKFKRAIPFGWSLNWILYSGGQIGLTIGAATLALLI